MGAFVGAVSAQEPRNWALCKEVGLWGVPGLSRALPRVVSGERLFIWKSRAGYIAEATITGPARVPESRDDAPWPGGLGRFRAVIPMRVVREVADSYRLPFVRDKQDITGISTNSLRFGLIPIMDEAADHISAVLWERDALPSV